MAVLTPIDKLPVLDPHQLQNLLLQHEDALEQHEHHLSRIAALERQLIEHSTALSAARREAIEAKTEIISLKKQLEAVKVNTADDGPAWRR